jgi:hypothetical protein
MPLICEFNKVQTKYRIFKLLDKALNCLIAQNVVLTMVVLENLNMSVFNKCVNYKVLCN